MANPEMWFDLADNVKAAEAKAAVGDNAGFFNEIAPCSTYMASILSGNVLQVLPDVGVKIIFGKQVPSKPYLMALLQPAMFAHGVEITSRFQFVTDGEVPFEELQTAVDEAIGSLRAVYSEAAQATFARMMQLDAGELEQKKPLQH